LTGDPSLIAASGTDTGIPGDATNAQALVATQTAPLSNLLDVQKGLAKIVSDFGTASADAKDAASFDKSVLTNLENARASTSGVSMDDEMVALMQTQHAFEALSKVINAAAALLQTLIDLKA
jgi:flagellar hook-associated protein 1 FlgK